MNSLRILLSVSILATASASAGAQTAFDKLAPENSVIIFAADNMQTTMDRFKETGLWSLWENEDVKELRADFMEELSKSMTKMFEELGVEEDSLTAPSGPMGFVVFPVKDEELGTTSISFLAMADYGENADKTESLIKAALDRGREDGALETDEKDILDFTATSVSFIEPESDEEFDDMDMGFNPMPGREAIFGSMQEIHFLRAGNTFLFSSDLASLTQATEAHQGDGDKSVSDRPDFQSVKGKLGECDFYGVILTRDLGQLVSSMDPMGMAGMMTPTLKALVGEIKGAGFGVRFDGDKAMFEQTMAVYMPNGKAGLTDLVDTPAPRQSLPSFAHSNSYSYSSFNIKFGEIMDVVRNVVNSNPMLAAQGQQGLDSVEPTVRSITSTLGTRMHVIQSSNKPVTAASNASVCAIECTKPQEFESVFSGLVAEMGVNSRDFLGQRIYTIDLGEMGMMPPMMPMALPEVSLGIGGGFVFVGATEAVEQSLRAVSEPGEAGLSTETGFQRGAGLLSNEPVVAWGYSNPVDSFEVSMANQREAMKQSIEEMRQWSPEFADEMEQSNKEAMAMWENIDFDLFRQYIGPSSWEIRSTPDGFVGFFYQLPADE